MCWSNSADLFLCRQRTKDQVRAQPTGQLLQGREVDSSQGHRKSIHFSPRPHVYWKKKKSNCCPVTQGDLSCVTAGGLSYSDDWLMDLLQVLLRVTTVTMALVKIRQNMEAEANCTGQPVIMTHHLLTPIHLTLITLLPPSPPSPPPLTPYTCAHHGCCSFCYHGDRAAGISVERIEKRHSLTHGISPLYR